MATNPMKVRFDEDNLTWLEAQHQTTGYNLTRLINQSLRSFREDITGERLLECLKLPPVVRMASTSTGFDVDRLKALLSRHQVKRILFAARPDPLNDFCLVVLIEMDDLTVIADTTDINHARRPRILEVRELFQYWDRIGLHDKTCYVTEHVTSTADCEPVEAARQLGCYPAKPFVLMPFLTLLAAYSVDIKERHYQSVQGYQVCLYRRGQGSLSATDDPEPIYQEHYNDEQEAQAMMARIVMASGGEAAGEYSLSLTCCGHWHGHPVSLARFVLPE